MSIRKALECALALRHDSSHGVKNEKDKVHMLLAESLTSQYGILSL